MLDEPDYCMEFDFSISSLGPLGCRPSVSGLDGSAGGIVLELRPDEDEVPVAGVLFWLADGTLLLGAPIPAPSVCAKAKEGRAISKAAQVMVNVFRI